MPVAADKIKGKRDTYNTRHIHVRILNQMHGGNAISSEFQVVKSDERDSSSPVEFLQGGERVDGEEQHQDQFDGKL